MHDAKKNKKQMSGKYRRGYQTLFNLVGTHFRSTLLSLLFPMASHTFFYKQPRKQTYHHLNRRLLDHHFQLKTKTNELKHLVITAFKYCLFIVYNQ